MSFGDLFVLSMYFENRGKQTFFIVLHKLFGDCQSNFTA